MRLIRPGAWPVARRIRPRTIRAVAIGAIDAAGPVPGSGLALAAPSHRAARAARRSYRGGSQGPRLARNPLARATRCVPSLRGRVAHTTEDAVRQDPRGAARDGHLRASG